VTEPSERVAPRPSALGYVAKGWIAGHARRYLEYFVEVGMAVRALRYGGGGRPEVEYRCENTEGDADPVTPPR
jgi:hypothetical protein